MDCERLLETNRTQQLPPPQVVCPGARSEPNPEQLVSLTPTILHTSIARPVSRQTQIPRPGHSKWSMDRAHF